MQQGEIATSSVNMENRRNLGIRSGDTVRVWQKIEEKGKTRLQAFEGLVLARKHGSEAGATFTVRRVSGGVGVEKIFPLYSPLIDKIEIVRRSKVRRAKLYHIREKVAREIKRQMRKMSIVNIASVSDTEEQAKAQQDAEAAAATEAETEKAAEVENTASEESVSAPEEVAETKEEAGPETVPAEEGEDSEKKE